jgi:hypothetical protein
MSNTPNKETICNKMLLSLLGSETLIELWWLSPNKAFDGRTPENVFKEDPNSVIEYIYQFY